jgi:hypothetical protein
MVGVVTSGTAEVERIDERGSRTILEHLEEGSVFGELLMFDRANDDSITVVCTRPCCVSFVPASSLLKRCEKACAHHTRVVENMFRSNSKRLCLSITFVLLTIALSQLSHTFSNGLEIKFSNLLVCMMLGTVFCNICDSAEELMEKTDKWTMPIFILFFVISGAELEFSFFKSWVVILVGVVYILVRALGKYVGAALSAKVTGCDKNIVKYLGVTLFPQAGVAIGMSLIAVELLGADGASVRNIVLFGVLIYELVGPLLTKIALTKAGEIVPEGKTSARLHFKKHGHIT